MRGGGTRPFLGNPNAIVSSVGGSITCPRTSGQTPMFVHVSASGITAVGTSTPYEDLEFTWDFGDPSGTEDFIRPTDGASVNANSRQAGPEGFYCYRSAGTYTITLTVRYSTAYGVYAAQTFTQSITVSAFSANSTVYYDSNATGANDGTSAADAFTSISNLSNATYWNNRRTNHLVRLARGSSWSGSLGIRIPNGASLSGSMSGVRIEAYQGAYSASTAKPIIDVTGSSDANDGVPCNVGAGFASSNTKSDFVFSNVRFTSSATTTHSKIINLVPGSGALAGFTDMYWDNCEAYSASTSSLGGGYDIVTWSSSPTAGSLERAGFWGGSIGTSLVTASNRRNLVGAGPDRWSVIFGTSISGTGGSSLLDHFIYPETQSHALYKWISIGNTGTGSGQMSFFLNLNYNGPTQQANGADGGFAYADYHVISECGVPSGVTQGLQYLCDGEQSDYPTAAFTGGGSANIVHDGGSTYATPPVNALVVLKTTGSLPAGVTAYTPYYVVSSTAGVDAFHGTIQISATQGGSAITFATTGSNCFFVSTLFRNVVIERNGLTAFTGNTSLIGILLQYVTWRGNRVWNYTGGPILNPPGTSTLTAVKAYGNKVDSPSGLGSTASYTGDMTSYTQALQWTDNVIVDRRASNILTQFTWSTMQGNGAVVNRNNYYTDATAVFKDASTTKTLAQSQSAGFEAASAVAAVSSAPWPSAPTSWNGFGA